MARISDERPKQALKTDVLVVGGDAAGLAAACTAAKAGARVLLVEKYGFCGGASVAGLSGTVCGLFAATDNRAAVPERVDRADWNFLLGTALFSASC
jgi:succinate dehydrogenase/fumarate reductase flavoprotein subunit